MVILGIVLILGAIVGFFVVWEWLRDEEQDLASVWPRVRDEPDPSDSAGA